MELTEAVAIGCSALRENDADPEDEDDEQEGYAGGAPKCRAVWNQRDCADQFRYGKEQAEGLRQEFRQAKILEGPSGALVVEKFSDPRNAEYGGEEKANSEDD